MCWKCFEHQSWTSGCFLGDAVSCGGNLYSAASLTWLWAYRNARSHRGKRVFLHFLLIMIFQLILFSGSLASLFTWIRCSLCSLTMFNIVLTKTRHEKKISSSPTQKKKRTWKNPNKSTVFLVLSFCDCYAKLSGFDLSLVYPISHFLLAFFLCCSALSLYK